MHLLQLRDIYGFSRKTKEGDKREILWITVFKRIENNFLPIFYQFLVLLNYSEQDQEFLSCSCSRLSLPSRPPFLIRYSSLKQDQSKYPVSVKSCSLVPSTPYTLGKYIGILGKYGGILGKL